MAATGVQGVCCRSSWQATMLESKADLTLPTALRIIQFMVSEASAAAVKSPAQLEPGLTTSSTSWAAPAGWRRGGLSAQPCAFRGICSPVNTEFWVKNKCQGGKRRPGGTLWCQEHTWKESSHLP